MTCRLVRGGGGAPCTRCAATSGPRRPIASGHQCPMAPGPHGARASGPQDTRSHDLRVPRHQNVRQFLLNARQRLDTP
eukprot:7836120-Pyramimonas_sp.AAC.1